MTRFAIRIVAIIALGLGLAACTLPRSAPVQKELLRGANTDEADFAVYEVTRAFLPSVAQWPRTGSQPNYKWIGHAGGFSGGRIAAGDKVDLTIWDSSDNSLLTAPQQKVVDLKGTTVASSGEIFVPYLDKIRVAGMTPDNAREKIQERMEAIIPSAQVQLTLTPGRRNSVDLVGGVNKPGSFPLADRNTTIMSLLSQGGGASAALENPLVRLNRGGASYAISLARLYAEPGLDTVLKGGDKVVVEEDPRYFIAVGAAGKQNLFPYTRARITAIEALATIGGISSARANPKGILVLREYPPSALSAGTRGPRKTRVVFTIDLTTADGVFSAGKFQINPGDVIFPTESPVTSVRTIFSLIGSVVGLGNQISSL